MNKHKLSIIKTISALVAVLLFAYRAYRFLEEKGLLKEARKRYQELEGERAAKKARFDEMMSGKLNDTPKSTIDSATVSEAVKSVIDETPIAVSSKQLKKSLKKAKASGKPEDQVSW